MRDRDSESCQERSPIRSLTCRLLRSSSRIAASGPARRYPSGRGIGLIAQLLPPGVEGLSADAELSGCLALPEASLFRRSDQPPSEGGVVALIVEALRVREREVHASRAEIISQAVG